MKNHFLDVEASFFTHAEQFLSAKNFHNMSQNIY